MQRQSILSGVMMFKLPRQKARLFSEKKEGDKEDDTAKKMERETSPYMHMENNLTKGIENFVYATIFTAKCYKIDIWLRRRGRDISYGDGDTRHWSKSESDKEGRIFDGFRSGYASVPHVAEVSWPFYF